MALKTADLSGKDQVNVLRGQTFAGHSVEPVMSMKDKGGNASLVILKAGPYHITFSRETPESVQSPDEAKATVKWWSRGIIGEKEVQHTAEYVIKDLIENLPAFGKVYGDYSQLKFPREVMKAVKLAADVNALCRSEGVRELFAGLSEDKKKHMPHIQQ